MFYSLMEAIIICTPQNNLCLQKGVSTMDTNMKTIQVNVDWEHVGVKSIARVGDHTVLEMGRGYKARAKITGLHLLKSCCRLWARCLMIFLTGLARRSV